MKTNLKWHKTVSAAAAVAIAGMIGLSGCGAGGSAASAFAPATTTQSSQTDRQQARANIVGRVIEDNTGKDRRLQSVDTIEVTATNLDNGKRLTTTADKAGNYRFDDVELGDYQIVAQKRGATIGIVKVTLREPKEVKVKPVVLTATGSIKGQIEGYGQAVKMVYIPGTSYVAIPDDQGIFELTNVPVGDYTLRFVTGENNPDTYDNMGGHYDRDVHVSAEGTDLGKVDIHPFDVQYAYIWGSSVNQFNQNGIEVRLSRPALKSSIETAIKLYKTTSDGTDEEVAVKIQMPDNENESEDFHVIPTNEQGAGEYKLVIADSLQSYDGKTLAQPYVKTYTIERYIDMETHTYSDASNFKTKVVLTFPQKVAPEDRNMSVKIVDENGKEVPNLVKMWKDNQLTLMADFEHDKAYKVVLPEAIIDKYGKLQGNNVSFYADAWIENINASWDYDTPTEQKIQCRIYGKSMIDLTSIHVYVTIDGNKKIEIPNDQLHVDGEHWNNELLINFTQKVPYSSRYTVEVTAKDVWGKAISKIQTFTTITPEIYNFAPSDYDMEQGEVQISSNVALKEGGHVLFVDENNQSKALPLKKREWGDGLYYELDGLGRVGDFIKPAHTYTVKLEGVQTKDGNATVSVTPQQVTFPPVSIISMSVHNGDTDVDPEMVDHHVSFQFFGFLSDAQKSAIEGNLTVTSYRNPLKSDATHPKPKVVWDDEEHDKGTVMGVAFTMDPDTHYEIALKDGVSIPGVVLESKLLTFKTRGNDQSTGNKPELDVISYAGFNGDASIDRNASGDPVGYTIPYYANFKYPVATMTDEYGYIRCAPALDTKKIVQNVHLYDNINHKDINLSGHIHVNSYVESDWNNGQRMCVQSGWIDMGIPINEYDSNVSVKLKVDAANDQYRLTDTQKTSTGHMPKFGQFDIYPDGHTTDTYTIAIHSLTPMNLKELNASLHDANFFKVDPSSDIMDIKWDEWQAIDDDQNNTYVNEVRIELAKPKYSLVQVTVGGGNGISGLDLFTHQTAPMMTEATSKVIEIHPDLTPLKVEKVVPKMWNKELNRAIRITFNRLVKPEDVATFDADGNLTAVPVVLTPAIDIESVAVDYSMTGNIDGAKSVLYILKTPMDANQTYHLKLDTNKTIRTITDTYEINDLNLTIQPVLGVLDEPRVVRLDYSLYDNVNEENPLQPGDDRYATNGYKYQVNYPIHLAKGVVADLNHATFKYNSYGTVYPATKAWLHDGYVITVADGLNTNYNLKADAIIPLKAGNVTETLDKTFTQLNSRTHDGISEASMADDGTIHLEVYDLMFQASDDNFEVSDSSGQDVNSSGFYISTNGDNIDLNASIFDANTTYCTKVYNLYGEGEYDDRFCFTTPE